MSRGNNKKNFVQKPLIIESDRSICVETDHPQYHELREQLSRFAELEKSPEQLHTYRVSPISIWNAAALGLHGDEILKFLEAHSRYPIPGPVTQRIRTWHRRFGALVLQRAASGPHRGKLVITGKDAATYAEARKKAAIDSFVRAEFENGFVIDDDARGAIKQILTQAEFPIEDVAGFVDGASLRFSLRSKCLSGRPFSLRKYQKESVDSFYAGGAARGGSGVVVLPCGAGKTLVGIAALERLQMAALILTTSTAAVNQWCNELLDKTTLTRDEVGGYTGQKKDVKPVTVTTYQMLTYKRGRDGDYKHFELFDGRDWGLVIYDEVHLLPAPVFSMTAGLQARRRLGLTATLVREDGEEARVFSLIGPKRYEAPWRSLERDGFIATAVCREVRVPLDAATARQYQHAQKREQFRIAAENAAKIELVRALAERHKNEFVLVLGQYLEQLAVLAEQLEAPLITGNTPNDRREELFSQFRKGTIPLLVISKVGNFAIDLPDANIAIQVSGTFGSRQEEAQRLGRVLRPKSDGRPAIFYSVVSEGTREREFAMKRERFLTEQGYTYEIIQSNMLVSHLSNGGLPRKDVVA